MASAFTPSIVYTARRYIAFLHYNVRPRIQVSHSERTLLTSATASSLIVEKVYERIDTSTKKLIRQTHPKAVTARTSQKQGIAQASIKHH
jgi:hypothetical protein